MGADVSSRYNPPAMALHWLIAALLLTNIGLAWYFNTLHGLAKDVPVQWHKSIGITVLILSLMRLAWRFIAPPPPLPRSVRGWERLVANTVYVLFYGVMIGMPLSGWALSSASPLIHFRPIRLYGLVTWPAIGPLTTLPHDQMTFAHETAVSVHGLLAKMAYALIVLHVGAALRHYFLLKDGVVGRMTPFLKVRGA